jgi:NitT/TauT family transport system permease protein
VNRWRHWGPPLASVAAALAVWEAVVVGFRLPEYLLPPPSGILAALAQEWRYLALHTGVTVYEILCGFVLAAAVGVPLAVLIVYSPLLERALYPLLVASQSVPKIAIAPLLIFWAGLGLFPKVLVAFLIAFFPVVIDTVVGLRSVEPEMLHLARSMGASEGKVFLKIRLPHALPNIFAGFKVAVTLAVVGAIVGEFIQADRGLGYALLQANAMLNTRLSFATILILGAVGTVLFAVVDALERRLIPWHASRRLEAAAGTW